MSATVLVGRGFEFLVDLGVMSDAESVGNPCWVKRSVSLRSSAMYLFRFTALSLET